MTLLQLICLLAAIGLFWYLLVSVVPLPPTGAIVVNVIFVIILIAILLHVSGFDTVLIR